MATPAATPTPPFPAGRASRLGAAMARRRNPLRRPSDRLRSRLRITLVVGLLASVGLSAGFALALYRHDRAAALRRDAHLHMVQAVLLTAPAKAPANDTQTQSSALVRWSGPGGTVHQETVSVPVNAAVGGRIQLWLDGADKPAAAPATADASATSAAFLSVLVLLAMAGIVTAAYDAGRAWADRTDDMHWGQEWRRFEPEWSRRA